MKEPIDHRAQVSSILRKKNLNSMKNQWGGREDNQSTNDPEAMLSLS